MKLFHWYLSAWALETTLWLVGVLWASHAGADMARLSLEQPEISHPSFAKEDSVASVANSAKPAFEAQIPQPSNPKYQLEGSTARRQMQAASYGRLPLSFELNQGQAHKTVKFLSRGRSHCLFLTATTAVLQFPTRNLGSRNEKLENNHTRPPIAGSRTHSPKSATRSPKLAVIRVQLVGSDPNTQVSGEQELPGKSHYFIGNDPRRWLVNVPNYSKVHYKGVYPGIDLFYYGGQQQLEYDFVVTPGGDPRSIRLRFEGTVARGGRPPVQIDAQGDLLLQTEGGEIYQRKAVLFQEINGTRQPIAGGYVLKGKREVGFDLGLYDTSKALIIDPVLSYSATGIGGTAIAVDTFGNAYVAGIASPDFITTPGAFQTNPGGGTCVSGPKTVPARISWWRN